MHKISRRCAYLSLLAAAALQVFISSYPIGHAIKPNIMLLAMVFYGLFTDERFGCEIGAACGLILDVFSIRPLGLNALLFGCAGHVIGRYRLKFYRHSSITHFIVTFAASYAVLAAYYLFINKIYSQPESAWAGLLCSPAVLATCLVNSIAAVFAYPFFLEYYGLSGEEL